MRVGSTLAGLPIAKFSTQNSSFSVKNRFDAFRKRGLLIARVSLTPRPEACTTRFGQDTMVPAWA
jgi:hypothetical protein